MIKKERNEEERIRVSDKVSVRTGKEEETNRRLNDKAREERGRDMEKKVREEIRKGKGIRIKVRG